MIHYYKNESWRNSTKGKEPFSKGNERLRVKNVEESELSAETKSEVEALVHLRLEKLEEHYDCVKYELRDSIPNKNSEGKVISWTYKGKFFCFEKITEIKNNRGKIFIEGDER